MADSSISLEALVEIAEGATPGPWKWDDEKEDPTDEWGHQPPDLMSAKGDCVLSSWGYDADGVEVEEFDKQFIATFNPALVLDLLTELKELRQKANLV